MKNKLSTSDLFKKLAETPSLHTVINNVGEGMDLCQYINALLETVGIDIPTLAKNMLASRPFVYQIIDGTRKPSRDMLFRMAFVLQLSLPQTQRLLILAQRGSLYPRVRRDAVIIYAIEHGYTLFQADDALSSVHEQPLLQQVE